MTVYSKHYNIKQTPQTARIPGTSQELNPGGGYSFVVDDWVRLDRFLILGNEGGSYYAGESKMTRDAAAVVERLLKVDGVLVVRRIAQISESGRAPKNDPALFALALCAAFGDKETRSEVQRALPRVARIGTHLFHFLATVDGLRGWGRSLRSTVGGWYETMPLPKLALQAVKYQQRDGWSHRDALRLSHPVADKTGSTTRNELFRWMTHGWPDVGVLPHPDSTLAFVWAFERVKRATDVEDVVSLIQTYNLPREAIPTQWLKDEKVWAALLEKMPLEAMIRNLAVMTRVGLLKPLAASTSLVVKRLGDQEAIKSARLHPIKILAALMTYSSGHGVRSQGADWTPVQQIVEALDTAFYLSFKAVEPTGKRIVYAIDISGSMTGGEVAGVPGLDPRTAAAALALVGAATEPNYHIIGFSSRDVRLAIGPRMRLNDAVKEIAKLHNGESTDCALPMAVAVTDKLEVDAFVIFTDSISYAGKIHPNQALQAYRKQSGINAKMIVVGMVSGKFTIADPKDAGQMDVIGFDTATPQLIADFIKG